MGEALEGEGTKMAQFKKLDITGPRGRQLRTGRPYMGGGEKALQGTSTLATWCKELTHWERLTLGRIEAKRRRGQQDEMVGWHHQLNGH